MDVPTNILRAMSVEHTDEDGYCVHCEVCLAHAYDCPSQQARILLGEPLLKTLIERQYEDALEQRRYTQWREGGRAAENDALWESLLQGYRREAALWSLLSSAYDGGPQEIVWVEEE